MYPSLGQLEELILLVVINLQETEKAYGPKVVAAYTAHTDKTISLPAVHTVLRRLEDKGYLRSELGGATADRGGRRKRIYEITRYGYQALSTLRTQREKLWSQAPKLRFS